MFPICSLCDNLDYITLVQGMIFFMLGMKHEFAFFALSVSSDERYGISFLAI